MCMDMYRASSGVEVDLVSSGQEVDVVSSGVEVNMASSRVEVNVASIYSGVEIRKFQYSCVCYLGYSGSLCNQMER